MTILTKSSNTGLTRLSRTETEALNELIKQGEVENTVKTYTNAMRQLQKHGYALPVSSQSLLKFFLTLRQQGKKASTISTYINIIAKAQTSLGFANPVSSRLTDALEAYRRTCPSRSLKGARFSIDELTQVAQYLYNDHTDRILRDRVLFLAALWTGSRTDELSRMTFETTECNSTEISFTVFGAKNYQGESLTKQVPKLYTEHSELTKHLCIVTAFESYKSKLQCSSGHIFRRLSKSGNILEKGLSERSIGNVIKSILLNAGLDSHRVAKLNGHSFRHTLADLGSQIGLNSQAIMKLGGWKKEDTISEYTGDHRLSAINEIAQELIRKSS